MRSLYLSVPILFALAQSTTVPAPPAAGGASSQPAPPASAAEVITPKDPKERMDLARKVNGLQGLDVPWHLKASYEVFGADGKSSDTGTYEEWRVNATQYRVALHGSSVSVEEYGTDHGVFRTGEQDWPGRPLSSIQTMVERPIFPERNPEKTVLQNYERSFWQGEGGVYRVDGSRRANNSSKFPVILLRSEQCCSFLRQHCESEVSDPVSTCRCRSWSLPCQRYAKVRRGQAVAEDSRGRAGGYRSGGPVGVDGSSRCIAGERSC